MASAVTKGTLYSDIWKNFYDTIGNDVVGKTVTDTHGVNHKLSRATSSFPDTEIDNKSTYPILVIDPPNISTERFTLDKSKVTGTISISIYTTASEAADKFMNRIIDSIETSKGDLADKDLHNIDLDSTDSDSAQRSQIKVHVRTATFSFTYRYTRTRAF